MYFLYFLCVSLSCNIIPTIFQLYFLKGDTTPSIVNLFYNFSMLLYHIFIAEGYILFWILFISHKHIHPFKFLTSGKLIKFDQI